MIVKMNQIKQNIPYSSTELKKGTSRHDCSIQMNTLQFQYDEQNNWDQVK